MGNNINDYWKISLLLLLVSNVTDLENLEYSSS